MATQTPPAERFMLILLDAALQKLEALDASTDMKAIYRIEGKMRAMVSMARLAAVARPVTDAEPAAEDAPPNGETGEDMRARLERRLESIHREIERKRAEIAAETGWDAEDPTAPGRSSPPPTRPPAPSGPPPPR